MTVPQSPFDRLRRILGETPPGADPVDFSVGGPKHAPPDFIGEIIAAETAAFRPYPPIAGNANFQRAVHGWIDRRYELDGWFDTAGALLPLAGSREGLVLSLVTARDWLAKPRPTVLYANPYYQAYLSAAHVIGAEATAMRTPAGPSPLPDFAAVPEAVLDRAIAYYFGSPSNPVGSVASAADWHTLFDRAERHDFFLFADECYSEIYREAHGAPVGALEVARERPEILKRLIVLNSLSKRSNVPGMRVGFVAGAPDVIEAMKSLRNQIAPQVPLPLQDAAAAAYDDEAHVIENRRLYDEKFAAAEEILGPLFDGAVTPAGGFCLWLAVGDDVAVTEALWREKGVKVIPGSLLASGEGADNPGAGHIRLALVAPYEETREGLTRVAALLAPQAAPKRAVTAR
ncbi:aminotransferase class I/II-fold pyridoxal phosphate-dependent enzyme [Acuticoccus sp. I52.16.1]|uniref:aminotransferase class I/II-fold pyridoxal phosphate-dependent enzyme n=1 Tax=Acuticoccus sp. I52.16.1 TaxID=2928472 RepID=UPI001FD2932F|nr:aminotransferase class I/II-fold pyridoxal phosphate-dependent enzyme [Acuticoccus sp. I52.16.1]UOM33577.1 aminotransferase class I/II-fold pyridoxal phosphate-dependent enzyme [Acuticoccus sp. I52.16.1]